MTDHMHEQNEPPPASPKWVFWGFLLIAGLFLALEHRAHLADYMPYLPYLLLLACPLLHLFHRHGGHTGSGDRQLGNDQDRNLKP